MELGILGILAAAVPFGIWWYKRRAAQQDANEPAKRDKEIDRAFASDNPDDRAGELQSVDDRLRRAEVEDGPPRQ
jgi:hypothetical protein